MRKLYADAGREVRALIEKEGESSVWRRVAADSNRNAVTTLAAQGRSRPVILGATGEFLPSRRA